MLRQKRENKSGICGCCRTVISRLPACTLPVHSLRITGVFHKLLAWQLWVLTIAMFAVYAHNDNSGGVALEGGLKGRTVGVADLATFSLDSVTSGASAGSYFHWKRVELGFYGWIIFKIKLTLSGFSNVTYPSFNKIQSPQEVHRTFPSVNLLNKH